MCFGYLGGEAEHGYFPLHAKVAEIIISEKGKRLTGQFFCARQCAASKIARSIGSCDPGLVSRDRTDWRLWNAAHMRPPTKSEKRDAPGTPATEARPAATT